MNYKLFEGELEEVTQQRMRIPAGEFLFAMAQMCA